MRRVLAWLDDRTGLSGVVKPLLDHPVPPTGWDYTIGSASLAAFVVQVVTGVALGFSYVPAPDNAYESLEFITHQAILGSVVRGIHFWGASAMVLGGFGRRWAALALAAFTVAASFMANAFWTVEGPARGPQMNAFFEHLGLAVVRVEVLDLEERAHS